MTSLFSDLVAITPSLGPQAAPGLTQNASGLTAESPPGLVPESMPFVRIFADLIQQNATANPLDQPSLQAVNLGPSLQLITVATPAPDEASLAEFAMSQGIGEPAIRYLLGDQAAIKETSPLMSQADMLQADMLQADMLQAEEGLLPKGSHEILDTIGEIQEIDPPADEATFLAASALIAHRVSLPQAQTVGSSLSQSASQPSDSPELLPLAVRGLGPLARQPNAAPGSSTPKAPMSPTATMAQQQGLQPNPDTSTAEVEIEIDLEALLAPPRQSQAVGARAVPAQDWLTSRLAAEQSRVESVIEPRNPVIGSERPHPPNSPLPANPMPDDAAADYELLSRRLGEAIAQRLVQQIERGEWQIRFKLTPRSLGDVRVDLQVRNGTLEATILASQSVTRDLLNDGLTRLRDALSSSGMDVAYLSVGSDGSRQDGGKPTPGQMLQHGRAQRVDAADTEGKAAVSTPSSMDSNSGGWDVLV